MFQMAIEVSESFKLITISTYQYMFFYCFIHNDHLEWLHKNMNTLFCTMIKLGPALSLTTKYLLSIGMNERWRDGKQYIYTILRPAVTVHKQFEPAFTQLRRKVFRHAGQLCRRWLAACLHRGVVYLYIQLANTNLKQDTYNLLYLDFLLYCAAAISLLIY